MCQWFWRVRRKAKSWNRQMSWGRVIADHLDLMWMSDGTMQWPGAQEAQQGEGRKGTN